MHCSRPAPTARSSGELAAVGGPPAGLPRPLPGSVRLTNTHTHASKVVTVGIDGWFSLSIATGSYTLTGKSPQHNADSPTTVSRQRAAVVVSSKAATSDVDCEEK